MKKRTPEEQDVVVTAPETPEAKRTQEAATTVVLPETAEGKEAREQLEQAAAAEAAALEASRAAKAEQDARRSPFEELLRHLTTDRDHEAMLAIVAAELAKLDG